MTNKFESVLPGDSQIQDPDKAEAMARAGSVYRDDALRFESKGKSGEWSREVADKAEEEAGIKFDEAKTIETMPLDQLKLRAEINQARHRRAYDIRDAFIDATGGTIAALSLSEELQKFRKLLDTEVSVSNALNSVDQARIRELEGK